MQATKTNVLSSLNLLCVFSFKPNFSLN